MIKLDIQMFGSTNKTTNYELPQFVGTDKPTWLGDFNTAMSTIDSGMAENKGDITSLGTRVTNAEGVATQASQAVTSLSSEVSTLSTNVSSVTTTANNAQSTATSALNIANQANGKADTNASDITALTTTVSDLQDEIIADEETLNGLHGNRLWTNSNPTTQFTAQTINLSESLTNYDYYSVIFRQNLTSSRYFNTGKIPVGYGTILNYGTNIRATGQTVTGNTITFEAGSPDNNYCIPEIVLGYKL